jgi:hypothetical protein
MRKAVILLLTIVVGTLIASLLLSAFEIPVLGKSWNLAKVAEFSDTLGPLNALLAATAALAAFAALNAQKRENAALAARAEADQRSATRRDFENTFFRMLDLLRSTVDETRAKHPHVSEPFSGRNAFKMILDYHGLTTGTDEFDKSRWDQIYTQYQSQLGHYFRLLYQIVRFVDESPVPDKMLYIRTLRATLSNPEIVLLGLNAWHGDYPKMRIFIEKYSLLHNITASEAVSRRINSAFAAGAFGDRDLILESTRKSGAD